MALNEMQEMGRCNPNSANKEITTLLAYYIETKNWFLCSTCSTSSFIHSHTDGPVSGSAWGPVLCPRILGTYRRLQRAAVKPPTFRSVNGLVIFLLTGWYNLRAAGNLSKLGTLRVHRVYIGIVLKPSVASLTLSGSTFKKGISLVCRSK